MQTDEAIRKQQDMVAALGELATPMDQYNLKAMQLKQTLDQGRITQETYNKALIAASPAFQAASEAINSMGQQITSGLTDIVMGQKSVAEGAKAMATAVLRSLTEMIIKMQITIPLMTALKALAGGGSFTSSLIGGMSGAGLVGGGAAVGGAAALGGGGLAKLLGSGGSVGGGGDKGVEFVNPADVNRFDAQALSSGPSFGDTWNWNIEGAFRKGGLVGRDRGTPTWVHPAYFENAPHFARGGMITDDGVPIIAHPGERVLNKEETQAYGRGGGGVRIGGTIINIQGDASEKTVAMIDQRISQRQQEIPSLVIRTMQDAKSRRIGGI
jgi:hypothetical protein